MPTRQSARSGGLLVVALVAVGWLFLVTAGVDVAQSLRLTGVIALQGLAGGIFWRSVRKGPIPLVEQAGVGLALGTTMSMIAGLVVTTLGLGSWGWFVPVLVSGVWWLVARRRHTGGLGGSRPSHYGRTGRDLRRRVGLPRAEPAQLSARLDGHLEPVPPGHALLRGARHLDVATRTAGLDLHPGWPRPLPLARLRLERSGHRRCGCRPLRRPYSCPAVRLRGGVLPHRHRVGTTPVTGGVGAGACGGAARHGRLRRSHLRGDLQLRLPVPVAHDTVAGGAGIHRDPTPPCRW